MPLPYVLSPTDTASLDVEALNGGEAEPSEGVHISLVQVEPEGQE